MKRRLLSTLLALSLCLSLTAFAAAADAEAIQAADELYLLGLFSGTGVDESGKPIYSLDRVPTRQEAVTMLVRLLGKTDEAEAGSWQMPFTDVDDWAQPYVGYAYENGLTAGTSATTFGAAEPVSASQYLTFVLRALGYDDTAGDFAWDSAWTLSDALGLTDGRYNAQGGSFLRADVVRISRDALSQPLKGATTLLGSTVADAVEGQVWTCSGEWQTARYAELVGGLCSFWITDPTFVTFTYGGLPETFVRAGDIFQLLALLTGGYTVMDNSNPYLSGTIDYADTLEGDTDTFQYRYWDEYRSVSQTQRMLAYTVGGKTLTLCAGYKAGAGDTGVLRLQDGCRVLRQNDCDYVVLDDLLDYFGFDREPEFFTLEDGSAAIRLVAR